MPSFPVSYSVCCTQTLLSDVLPLFQIEQPLECIFWCQGLNDSYKVVTAKQTYLLRIYRYGWRQLEEINFELDALLYLHKKGLDIAYPIATHSGEYTVAVNCAEGLRHAILTRYIDGQEINIDKLEDIERYAHQIALLHIHSEDFSSKHLRFQLDVQHLVTEPLQRIKPFLQDREKDWLFISEYGQELTATLKAALENRIDFGFCHGDLHGGNAHQYDQQLALFDFDCCALGLRCYDLAVFKWSLLLQDKNLTLWNAFIEKYQQYRPLQTQQMTLIDSLVSIRQLWLMGVHIEIAVAKGWLNERYFDEKIAFLRKQRDALQTKKPSV